MATPHGLDFAHAAALYGCGTSASQAGAVPRGADAALGRRLHPDPRAHRPRRQRRAAPRDLAGRPGRRSSFPAPMTQEPLIEIPGRAGGSRRAETSKGIGAGDIVLVDKSGRRFHALVTELEQLDSGRFELS